MSHVKMRIQSSKSKNLEWQEAPDAGKIVTSILNRLEFPHIDPGRIFVYRTRGSKSRAYARIWAMPKIFQHALGVEPAYVIEVVSKYFDKLSEDEKSRVLIHELLHIPKNFSGALLPHRGRQRHIDRDAKKLFEQYKKAGKTKRSFFKF